MFLEAAFKLICQCLPPPCRFYGGEESWEEDSLTVQLHTFRLVVDSLSALPISMSTQFILGAGLFPGDVNSLS
jgi:hypothetical protein